MMMIVVMMTVLKVLSRQVIMHIYVKNIVIWGGTIFWLGLAPQGGHTKIWGGQFDKNLLCDVSCVTF